MTPVASRDVEWRLRPPSKPVAMTVTMTSSPRRSLKLVPKMMLASGSAASLMASAASWTSNSDRVEDPVMFHRMPWAPLMSTSSSGLAMAIRAASTARFSPVARPMPISAEPASFMIARTSAKSWLIKPGHRDDVADALDALAQDVVDDPERVEDARVLLDDVLEPVVRDRDEGVDLAP